MRQQHFFFGGVEDEGLVVALYLVHFVGFELVAVAVVQQMFDLGVELRVIYVVEADAVYFKTEEAAVAGGVVQHLGVIAGAGKGSYVGEVLRAACVGQAQGDGAAGDEVLQLAQFAAVHALVLVEVDEHELADARQVVFVAGGDGAGAQVLGTQLGGATGG